MTGTASRRHVLAGTAAALVAPAAGSMAEASAGAPDARLLELREAACRAFRVLERTAGLWSEATDAGDDAAAELHDARCDEAQDAYEAALFAMADIPAASLLGLAAKACFAHGIADGGASDAELELLRSLSADAARILGGRGPAPRLAPPDAELVAACDAYAEAVQRFNDEGGHLEPEVCPLWRAVDAARDRALAAPPPRSLAGIRAKAELCRAMALRGTDGRRDYSDSYCGTWPGQVVEDVLRLVVPGGAA